MEQVFQVGEKVRVIVLRVDLEMKKVTLSTKRLERNPADMLLDRESVYAHAEETIAPLLEARKQDKGLIKL